MNTYPASRFSRTLDEVHRHAGNDFTLPAITCVRFEVFPDRIIMVATDQFTLLSGCVPSCAELDPTEVKDLDETNIYQADPEAFLLNLADAKALMSALRAQKATKATDRRTLTITREDKKVQFRLGDQIVGDYHEHESDFPQWRPLIKRVANKMTTRINVAKLGGRKALHLCAQTDNPTGPSLLRADLHSDLDLMGLVMPINMPASASNTDDLFHRYGVIDTSAEAEAVTPETPDTTTADAVGDEADGSDGAEKEETTPDAAPVAS